MRVIAKTLASARVTASLGLGAALALALGACGASLEGSRAPRGHAGHLPQGVRPAPPAGHLAPVRCLSFSPDGRRLVSGSEDSSLLVWDVKSGRVIQRLEGHQGAVTACAFLPDNQRVVSGGSKGDVFVWDASAGEKRPLFGLDSRAIISSLGVRSDGQEIIAGTLRGQILRWDIDRGSSERLEWPKSSAIRAAGYLDDGTPFAGADDGPVVVFSNPERRVPYPIGSGLALPGGRLVLGGDGEVAIAEPTGERKRLGAQEGSVYGLAVSPRRDWILAGDDRGNARAWDISGAEPALRCELPRSSRVWAAAIDPTGAYMAVAGEENAIVMAGIKDCVGGQSIEARKLRRLGTPQQRIAAVAAADDVILGDSGGNVSAWSPATWEMTGRWQAHRGEVVALHARPGGGWISGGSDRALIARDSINGAAPRSLGALKDLPSAIKMTADGAAAITADLYGDLTLLPLDGKPRVTLFAGSGAQSAAYAMAIRPLKNEIVAGGELPDLIRLGSPAAATPTRWPRAEAPSEHVTALAYSLDGRWLAEGGSDGVIALRDAATGSIARRLQGLTRSVFTLAFTDEHLWAGGSDRALIRWSLEGESPAATLRVDEGANIYGLAPTADGRFLIAALADGRAAVHELPSGELVAHLMPMRDGSYATLFPDGRFQTSGSGAVLDLTFEDPKTRKVVTLGGLVRLSIQSPTATRAEKVAIIKATILSPQGEPTATLDGRFPIDGIIPSPTVMSAYDLEVLVDDPSGAPHTIEVRGPDGQTARAEVKPEPYLRGGALHPRALVIGNGAYPGGPIPVLPGAVADAVSVEKALRSSESWGLDNDHITVLTNLGGRALTSAVESFFAKAEKGDTLLFYYAGHGIEQGGEGYLLPVDFAANKIKEALSATTLWKAVEGSKADRAVVLLDACRSGAFAFPTDIGGRLFNQSARHALVTATSTTGLAGETAKGGRFTQALLESFDKREALDQEREAVTLGKAFLYAYGKAYPQQLRLFGGLDTLPLAWPRDPSKYLLASAEVDTKAADEVVPGLGNTGAMGFGHPEAAPPPRVQREMNERDGDEARSVEGALLVEREAKGHGTASDSAYQANIVFNHDTERVSVGVYSTSAKRRYARPEVQKGPFKAGDRTTIFLPLKSLSPGSYEVMVKICWAGPTACVAQPPIKLAPFQIGPR